MQSNDSKVQNKLNDKINCFQIKSRF